jgi:hypothetical protein
MDHVDLAGSDRVSPDGRPLRENHTAVRRIGPSCTRPVAAVYLDRLSGPAPPKEKHGGTISLYGTLSVDLTAGASSV